MVVSQSYPKALELVSQITGQQLSHDRDLNPSVTFLASLVTLLLGVAYADAQITEEEKQRLLSTLYELSPEDGAVRRLVHLLIKGVRENKLYSSVDALTTLTASLSDSEKLMLIGFSLVTAIADGHIDEHEKQYLRFVAQHLKIDFRHLNILESRFCGQKVTDIDALEEVRSLLDPGQFHGFDPVLLKAANDISSILPQRMKHSEAQHHEAFTYAELDQFRERRKQVATAYYELLKVIRNCRNKGIVSASLEAETKLALKKLLSQRFRLAVIGEFSQGKSTLLNALTGEEIQPVRAIPCNGTITILKHGVKKRVICRYKDGREEEIAVENYQDKVCISEDAALDCVSDELAQSELIEVVFEHPSLAFCSSGVEIVDSPGLNEHPDRTAITQTVLKDTDAVIFLTNASKPLSWGERELLRDLQLQLNDGQRGLPAENLFIVVNFVDLLRRERDRQQVQQLVERFAYGSEPVVIGERRIHFISARAALDAVTEGRKNDYSQSFEEFTTAIETFLTQERGAIELKKSITKYQGLIQACMSSLSQAKALLEGEVDLSSVEQQELIEQIGIISGFDTSLRLLAKQLKQRINQETTEAWKKWLQGLHRRLEATKDSWRSTKGIFKPKELSQDYAQQFAQNLQSEFKIWQSKSMEAILNQNLKELDKKIQEVLVEIQQGFNSLDERIKTDFSDQFNIAINVVEPEIGGLWSALLMGMGVSGLETAAMMAFQVGKLALMPIAGVGLAVAVVSTIIFGLLGAQQKDEEIKKQVFDLAWKKFIETEQASLEKICVSLSEILDRRVEAVGKAIDYSIFLHESLLIQQARYQEETQAEQEVEKNWIMQELQELERLSDRMK